MASGTTSPIMAGEVSDFLVTSVGLTGSSTVSTGASSVADSSTFSGVLAFSFLAGPLRRALDLLRIRPMMPPDEDFSFLTSGSFVSTGVSVASVTAGVSLTGSTGFDSSIGLTSSAVSSALTSSLTASFLLLLFLKAEKSNRLRRRSVFSAGAASVDLLSSTGASPTTAGVSSAATMGSSALMTSGTGSAVVGSTAGVASATAASDAGTISSCFFSVVGLPKDLILSKNLEDRRPFFSSIFSSAFDSSRAGAATTGSSTGASGAISVASTTS